MEKELTQINKLCLDKFKINHIVAVIGGTRTDRILLTNKIFNKFNNTYKLILSHDPNISEYFTDISDNSLEICNQNFNDEIENLFSKHRNYYYSKIDHFKETILIIDDCSSEISLDNMRELFFNSRIFKITFIYLSQFYEKIRPELYYNLNYLFLFQHDNPQKQENLYNICHFISTIQEFDDIYSSLIQRYGVMVIDFRRKRIFDEIYYLKTKAAITKNNI